MPFDLDFPFYTQLYHLLVFAVLCLFWFKFHLQYNAIVYPDWLYYYNHFSVFACFCKIPISPSTYLSSSSGCKDIVAGFQFAKNVLGFMLWHPFQCFETILHNLFYTRLQLMTIVVPIISFALLNLLYCLVMSFNIMCINT